MTMRLFLLEPEVVFAARVNQSSFSYPLAECEYDNVTTGAYGDIEANMTVLFGTSAGADDLGRQRMRMLAGATTIYFGRSSRGTNDGEVYLEDDAYITVLNDYRVWSKTPYIDEDGNIYKDHELEVTTRTDDIPPKANGGEGVAGTIDSVSSKLEINLSSAASYALSGTISTTIWDVDDGTITVGTINSQDITVEFPAGFRWVSLQVVDSNGNTHGTWIPIYARDPASDTTVSAFTIENHVIRKDGQQFSFRILEDIDEGTYPDGTLVMLWEGEPSDGDDRSHMKFVGWHHTDPATIRAERTGILRDTVFDCLDAAGKLDTLPGFPISVEGDASPSSWLEMSDPNMDKYIDYIFRWHSTAFEVAHVTMSGTGSNYPFVILGSDAQSLWDQAARRCGSLVPDYVLTCNTRGQIAVKPDPIIQPVADRTSTVQATLTEADWSDLGYNRQRHPRVHWLRSEAVLAHASTVAAMFCVAPDKTPGQGESEQTHGEQLAINQSDLNASEGNRYARLNARESSLFITLAEGETDIEPADLTWVRMNITANKLFSPIAEGVGSQGRNHLFACMSTPKRCV